MECQEGETVPALQQRVQEMTLIPPHFQRWILKGKQLHFSSSSSSSSYSATTSLSPISDFIADGETVLLSGSAVSDVAATIEKSQRLANSVQLPQGKPSSVRSLAAFQHQQFTFASFETLSEFSDAHLALAYLHRLAEDRGIVAVMAKYQWRIGLLKELHPIKDSAILGYNRNKGQVIALRLRTNDFSGFRNYSEVKRVLIHELSHMVHSDHNNEFKTLNSELTGAVLELDWTKTKGYTLVKDPNFFQPPDYEDEKTWKRLADHPEQVDAHGYTGGSWVLGGGEVGGGDLEADLAAGEEEAEIRRRKLQDAALKRLNKQL